jgi:hypothetical protein
VDGADLLDVPLGEVHIGARLVLTEHEVRAVLFEISPFREANALILCVVFEASRLERHRGAWVRVAAFAVAGRSGTVVAVPTLCEPAVERFSEFFENALTGLRMQVRVAFVALEFAFEVPVIGNLAHVVPHALCVVATDVPELRRGPAEFVEVVTNLLLVRDRGLERSDGSRRHLAS